MAALVAQCLERRAGPAGDAVERHRHIFESVAVAIFKEDFSEVAAALGQGR